MDATVIDRHLQRVLLAHTGVGAKRPDMVQEIGQELADRATLVGRPGAAAHHNHREGTTTLGGLAVNRSGELDESIGGRPLNRSALPDGIRSDMASGGRIDPMSEHAAGSRAGELAQVSALVI